MKPDVIFIGLCNYPDQYIYTRHNIAKDFLLYIYQNSFIENKFYLYTNDIINSKNCLFIIPNFYMNNSGDVFKDSYLNNLLFNVNIKIVIIHDDLELKFGQYKLRNNVDRGERGHNGNRSINASLKNILKMKYRQPYYISIGIDRPIDRQIDKWVLQKFSNEEINYLKYTVFPEMKNKLNEIINLI